MKMTAVTGLVHGKSVVVKLFTIKKLWPKTFKKNQAKRGEWGQGEYLNDSPLLYVLMEERKKMKMGKMEKELLLMDILLEKDGKYSYWRNAFEKIK